MTKSQKLALRLSEIRQKLNELSGFDSDALTDEQRSEMTKLSDEYPRTETEWRAASIAESAAAETRRETGEGAEFRRLEAQTEIRHFLAEAATGVAVDGVAAEFRAATLGDDARPGLVPWEALLPRRREEHRVDTATDASALDVGASQNEILPRLFTNTSAAFLGVSMPMVARGEANFPVLTGGDPGAMAAAGAAHDAVAATFTATVLEPRRLVARYAFRVEDAARLIGMEDALRSDMRGALGEQMDSIVLNGDGASPNPSGFFATLTAPAAPGAQTGFDEFITAISNGVDGRYAGNLSGVRLLVGAESYRLAAGERTSTGEVSAADYLVQRSGGLQASALIPAPATVSVTGTDYPHIQSAISFAATRGGGSCVAPIWQGLELIRDPYSGAASGEVAITATMLWNFAILRVAPYSFVRFRTAT